MTLVGVGPTMEAGQLLLQVDGDGAQPLLRVDGDLSQAVGDGALQLPDGAGRQLPKPQVDGDGVQLLLHQAVGAGPQQQRLLQADGDGPHLPLVGQPLPQLVGHHLPQDGPLQPLAGPPPLQQVGHQPLRVGALQKLPQVGDGRKAPLHQAGVGKKLRRLQVGVGKE